MTERQQSKKPGRFQDVFLNVLSLILWVGIILVGIYLTVSISSTFYVPVFAGLILTGLGIMGAITKGMGIFFLRPILTIIEAFEHVYLAIVCGICCLCSLLLSLPAFSYFATNANNNGVAIAFGVATVGAAILGRLVLSKYKQMMKFENNP